MKENVDITYISKNEYNMVTEVKMEVDISGVSFITIQPLVGDQWLCLQVIGQPIQIITQCPQPVGSQTRSRSFLPDTQQ